MNCRQETIARSTYLCSLAFFIGVQAWISVARAQGARIDPPNPTPVNLDFEQGELGQIPPGWSLPKSAQKSGYEAVLASEQPHDGKHCVVVRSKTRTYLRTGTLMQTVDATPYRGKRVRFRAYAKAGSLGEGSQVQLWLRVDLPSGIGFFDDMVDRPIKSTDWHAYEIVGDVDDDAASISFGFVVRRDGTAFFDSARLDVVPGGQASKEFARAVTERG